MEDVAEKLKEFRKSSGKSQKEFADALGVAQKTWSNYENGITRPPMQLLFDLAEMGYIIKGLTSSFMEGWSEEKKKEFQRRINILKTGAFPLDLPMTDLVKMIKAVDSFPPAINFSKSDVKHPLVSDIEAIIKDNLKEPLEGLASRLKALESSMQELQAQKTVSLPEYPEESGGRESYTSDPEPAYGSSARIAYWDDIAAGPPISQSEDGSLVVDVPEYLIKTRPEDYYALRVRGNSMIDAFIPDGSKVLVRKADVPQNGKIQIVRLDGRVTLKRMREEEDRSWTLCYEDGTGRTIPLGDNNQVQGTFEAVLPPHTQPKMR